MPRPGVVPRPGTTIRRRLTPCPWTPEDVLGG